MGIARRLLTSVVAFGAHALFPFIPIEPRFDLESTAAFLKERNHFIEAAKDKSLRNSNLVSNSSHMGETISRTDNVPVTS